MENEIYFLFDNDLNEIKLRGVLLLFMILKNRMKNLLLLMEEEEDLETQGLNHLLIEHLENLQKALREKIFGYGFSLKQLLILG